MRRHRFEPARLLLGLLLTGVALAYAMDALGRWRIPTPLLLAAIPAALLAAACTALVTFAVRSAVRRHRAGRPRDLDAMPMDELRGGYAQSGAASDPSGPTRTDDDAGGSDGADGPRTD
ncbi:hypothetical protein [Streptomyces nanshensis]|uniref:hypothetical protein n=1 Tax=Streptomyces nanshensis TaxID=518642 RepID=UPI00085C1FEF|nr:hypothetical protein [Streptomyces nanshensis]